MQYVALKSQCERIDAMLSLGQQRLVEEQLTVSLRIARGLLKKWNFSVQNDELESVTALALCEAAKKFVAERGTQFTTFAYPYIKGMLINKFIRRGEEVELLELEEDSAATTNLEEQMEGLALHRKLHQLISKLDSAEQELIRGFYFDDRQVAELASKFRWSRANLMRRKRAVLEIIREGLVEGDIGG